MLHRQGYTHAAFVFSFAKRNVFEGYISASAITDIFYIARKDIGKKPAIEALKKILRVFKPATVTDSNIYQALAMDWSDFEDSVQYVVGESFDVDYIVTRNSQDFSSGSIPALTPEQFIQTITEDDEN